jgi:hypothetical protein
MARRQMVSQSSSWPDKYPWKLLPKKGLHPFKPPKKRNWLKTPRKGRQNGYLDADDNEWVPHPDPSGDEKKFHWDVQHPDGKHTNVRPDGGIDHGADNFSITAPTTSAGGEE